MASEKKKDPRTVRAELRREESEGAQGILQRIFVGKGRLQGNYYLVCDKVGKRAGLVVTLQALDKKGTIAVARGRKLKHRGLKYSKGKVIYRPKGGKLIFEHVSGNADVMSLKKAFREVLIKEYKLSVLRKAFVKFKTDDSKKKKKSAGHTTPDTPLATEEAIDSTVDARLTREDLGLDERAEKQLLEEMAKDEDLAVLFLKDSEAQQQLVAANELLQKTYFNATIELAVEMADHWWGEPDQPGWTPPPMQFPTKGNFVSRSRSKASKDAFFEQQRFSQEKMAAMMADYSSADEEKIEFYKLNYGIKNKGDLRRFWESRKTTQQLEALWNEKTSDQTLSERWDRLAPRVASDRPTDSDMKQKQADLFNEIRAMKPLLKTLNQERTHHLIRQVRTFHKKLERQPRWTKTLLRDAKQRLKTFQRLNKIKDIVDETGMPYDQASEHYLTQLYVDAARAQVRLKYLTETNFPPNDAEYEVKVPGAHQIKGTERARIKAQENEEGAASNFATLGDLARGSIYFKDLSKLVSGMQTFIKSLPPESIIPKFKNRFARGNHYRDIIITVTLDNNHVTEMQFHSKAIADIKSHGAVVSAPADQNRLQEAVRAIRALRDSSGAPLTPPLDTRAILQQISTGSSWALSGHDFYNITRWLDTIDGTERIVSKVSSVANQMYDDAFETAKRGMDLAALTQLENLTLQEVNSWRK